MGISIVFFYIIIKKKKNLQKNVNELKNLVKTHDKRFIDLETR